MSIGSGNRVYWVDPGSESSGAGVKVITAVVYGVTEQYYNVNHAVPRGLGRNTVKGGTAHHLLSKSAAHTSEVAALDAFIKECEHHYNQHRYAAEERKAMLDAALALRGTPPEAPKKPRLKLA